MKFNQLLNRWILLMGLYPFTVAGETIYWSAIVNSITPDGLGHRLELQALTNNMQDFPQRCKVLTVHLKYARVPAFPVVQSLHPKPEEHRQAIGYLDQSRRNGREIFFGYVRGGLVALDEDERGICEVKSKGLKKVELTSGEILVLSYHDLL